MNCEMGPRRSVGAARRGAMNGWENCDVFFSSAEHMSICLFPSTIPFLVSLVCSIGKGNVPTILLHFTPNES